jgi:hypothetical protein
MQTTTNLKTVERSALLPVDSLHPVWNALEEIQQARTDFQLQHFVVGQHDTSEQQYKQVLLELQELLFTIKHVDLQNKKTILEIEQLRSTKNPIDEVDAQIKELSIERALLARLGAVKEAQTLVKIWESFETKYTAEQIEANQVEYWNARLLRQAQLESMGGQSSISWGSLDALRQIGQLQPTLEQPTESETKELS